MSHIVSIATKIRDPVAVSAACQRLGLPPPARRLVQLFSATAEGLAIELPNWRFPVVCDTTNAELHYDNFNGRWGDQRELDRLLQAYGCEKAKLEARRQGHAVFEQPLADGSIKLTIQVGGGAFA